MFKLMNRYVPFLCILLKVFAPFMYHNDEMFFGKDQNSMGLVIFRLCSTSVMGPATKQFESRKLFNNKMFKLTKENK